MKKPRFAEKLSAALRRGKTVPASENSAPSAKAAPAPRSGASLPARALLAALFACGIFAGYCLCAAFESALMSAALDADLASARAVARRAPSFANAGRTGGVDEFTKENPFGADVRAVTNTEKQAAAKASPETLKSLTLRGTLPGVGAWIDVSGNTRLVLKGQSVEGFTLSDIKYSEALLSDGAGRTFALPVALGRRRQSGSLRRPQPQAHAALQRAAPSDGAARAREAGARLLGPRARLRRSGRGGAARACGRAADEPLRRAR